MTEVRSAAARTLVDPRCALIRVLFVAGLATLGWLLLLTMSAQASATEQHPPPAPLEDSTGAVTDTHGYTAEADGDTHEAHTNEAQTTGTGPSEDGVLTTLGSVSDDAADTVDDAIETAAEVTESAMSEATDAVDAIAETTPVTDLLTTAEPGPAEEPNAAGSERGSEPDTPPTTDASRPPSDPEPSATKAERDAGSAPKPASRDSGEAVPAAPPTPVSAPRAEGATPPHTTAAPVASSETSNTAHHEAELPTTPESHANTSCEAANTAQQQVPIVHVTPATSSPGQCAAGASDSVRHPTGDAALPCTSPD